MNKSNKMKITDFIKKRPETKLANFRIEVEKWNHLKIKLEKNKITMSSFFQAAIDAYLSEK